MKILTPIEKLYHVLSSTKRGLYESGILQKKKLPVPILSVGNISFGGVGKTPTVIMLAEEFSKKFKVNIVCKSYKAKLKRPAQVDLSRHDFAQMYGDEASLIQQKLKNSKVWSGSDKSEVAEASLQSQPELIILDDGFSHFKLQRNFDLVLIDSVVGLNSYLRESKKSLQRADAILLTKTNLVSTEKINKIKTEILLEASHLQGAIYESKSEIDLSLDTNNPLLVFCGLANPTSFVSSLKFKGYQIHHSIFFSDHFTYDQKNQLEILNIFNELKNKIPNLKLVTTEKDFVKLDLNSLKENLNVVVNSYQMENASKEDLIEKIRSSF